MTLICSINQVHMSAGIISWRDKLYSSLSAFALAAIHLHNPNRQSCNGWDEVRYDGQPLVRS